MNETKDFQGRRGFAEVIPRITRRTRTATRRQLNVYLQIVMRSVPVPFKPADREAGSRGAGLVDQFLLESCVSYPRLCHNSSARQRRSSPASEPRVQPNVRSMARISRQFGSCAVLLL